MAASDVAFEVSEARRTNSEVWRADSLCKKHPTRWWFAGGAHETVLAKGICAGCSVQSECLEFALSRPDLLGVWSSTTPNERAAIRRARRVTPDAAESDSHNASHEDPNLDLDLDLEAEALVDDRAEPFGLAVNAPPVAGAGIAVDGPPALPLDSPSDPQFDQSRDAVRRAGLGRRRSGFGDRGERNELFTPAEAARRLGVTPNTVTRWSRAGKISAIQTMGGHRRFRRAEIERVLREATLVAPGVVARRVDR
jgi:excisionase family DNA binding protein